MNISKWWSRHKLRGNTTRPATDTFTHDEMLQLRQEALAQGYEVGYSDGRNDGLAIAKQAASNILKESIWQQRKNKTNLTQRQTSYPKVEPNQ